MRAQFLATIIAMAASLSQAGCELLYPSISVSPTEDGGAGADAKPASTSGSDSASVDSGTVGPEGDAGAGDPAPLAFVQATSHDTRDSTSNISVTYSSAQHAGDLDVVVVGWTNPTRNVRSVTDSAGNAYALAMAPGTTTGVGIAIYYAKNIASAASNTVTITLDADDFPCVGILEYSGVSEIDQSIVATGSGSAASTGAVDTLFPRELVLAAGEPDQGGSSFFMSPGDGFGARVLTDISGMIVEDVLTEQRGSFRGGGALTKSSGWVMQVVTFH